MRRRQFLQTTLSVASSALLAGHMRAKGAARLRRPSKLPHSTVASAHSRALRSKNCKARFTVRSSYRVIPAMTTRADS